jgi:hypothetical protein
VNQMRSRQNSPCITFHLAHSTPLSTVRVSHYSVNYNTWIEIYQ